MEAAIALDVSARAAGSRARASGPGTKARAGDAAGSGSGAGALHAGAGDSAVREAEGRVVAEEEAARAREGLGSALSILDHVFEFRPAAAGRLATRSPILAWLLAHLRGSTSGEQGVEAEAGDHEAAELLAVVIGSSERARQVLASRAGAWGPAEHKGSGADGSAPEHLPAAGTRPHAGVAALLQHIAQSNRTDSASGAAPPVSSLDEAACLRLAGNDGVEALLLAASGTLRHDPESMPQREATECVFEALRGALADPSCRALFRKHEGTELMVRVVQRQGYASHCAAAALETALTEDPKACIAFVESGGLKAIVPLARGAARAATRRYADGDTADEEEQQAAVVLACCLQLLPGAARDAPLARNLPAATSGSASEAPRAFSPDHALRLRVLAKLLAGDGIALARMVEMVRDLGRSIASADDRVLAGLAESAPGGKVLATGFVSLAVAAAGVHSTSESGGDALQFDDTMDAEGRSVREAAIRDAGLPRLLRLSEALARCSLGDSRARGVVLRRMRELGVPCGCVRACLEREAAEVVEEEESGTGTVTDAGAGARLHRAREL